MKQTKGHHHVHRYLNPTTTTQARVAAGAQYLDQTQPGWEHKIDLAALDMESGCSCIIGQTMQDLAREAGAFTSGGPIDAYDWWIRTCGGDNEVALGLNLDYDTFANPDEQDASWADLEHEWTALIKNRFDTGTLSDA